MYSQALKYSFILKCKTKVWILALIWLAGLSAGSILSRFSEAYIIALMPMAALCRVSIVGLFICNLFPLLLAALAVHFFIPIVFDLLLFFRAISCGFLIFSLLPAFGFGGWLVGILFLTSPCVINSLLICLYLYSCEATVHEFRTALAVCMAIGTIIILVDYLYISPFLAYIVV